MSNYNDESINITNIDQYSTDDIDILLEKSLKNKFGFPIVWPTKNRVGKRTVLSFVNVSLEENGTRYTFDILDEETFDKKDKYAEIKVAFLGALLAEKNNVIGAVYYKGRFVETLKMADKKALTKALFHKYFHFEDGPLLLKYFVPLKGKRLTYWPRKSYEEGRDVIFAAVEASLASAENKNNIVEDHINFTVCKKDLFDLKNPSDMQKIKLVRDMLNDDRIVSGFYYKGKLLPTKLKKDFKLYLEKTFIKKNFCVEQRDFLFTYITRDVRTGAPIFWPMNDKKGRPIVASVVNASGADIPNAYANFDLYCDEPFDLTKEENKIKLGIIQEMLAGDKLISGCLYLDGMLIPGIESRSEVERRISKVEKALKVYISTNEDFIRISNNYTVEDREKLLRLGAQYNKFYPDATNANLVPLHFAYDAGEIIPLVHFENVNIVKEDGSYVFNEPFNLKVMNAEEVKALNCKEVVEILKGLVHPNVKVRGGIYFNGVNVNNTYLVRHSKAKHKEFMALAFNALPADVVESIKNYPSATPIYEFESDKKTHLPRFWATKNNEGREVLLSVVDADIHFKVGRYTVKACNNMNFDIYVGETFGLVGESGSGKTTISRGILGINKLSKGGIYYKGKLITGAMTRNESHAMKKNIQMIFQDPAASLNERANIDYIVSEGLYNFKLFKTKEERLEKVTSMMREVGLLPEHLSRYPHEFSGGQRQRIGIARALIIEPQLVLADEPISALDVSIRAQILNLLRKLQKTKEITYLFIAHDLSIIRYISDRIAVMHKGYIVELGPAEEIYSNPLHPYTRSLLTAIPQPDPRTKDQRKKVPYEQGDIVYSECEWVEMCPQHYVLVNDKLKKDIAKRVSKGKKAPAKVAEADSAEEKVAEKKPAAKKVSKKAAK